MNSNKRKGRPNSGPRQNRARTPNEKTIPLDGVYANTRFTHAAVSLIGCPAQVQVKNGAVYDGIFKTYSNKMEVVLELAHKVDNSSNVENSVPSKEQLIERLVLKWSDISTMTFPNAEVDYACKDAFTDIGISKFNGQITPRELQKWEGDGEGDELLLESSTAVSEPSNSNGWDAQDMFRKNAETFGVKSTYDPNLTEYTTQLEPKDTQLFRERSTEAEKIAREIEGTQNYKQSIELENGEDEEEKFSAVIRPQENNQQNQQPSTQSFVQNGRYVPPHKRNTAAPAGRGRGTPVNNNAQPPQVAPRAETVSPAEDNEKRRSTTPVSNVHQPSSNLSASVSPTPAPQGGAVNDLPADSSPNVSVSPSKTDPNLVQKEKRPPNAPTTSRDEETESLRKFSQNLVLVTKEHKEKQPPVEIQDATVEDEPTKVESVESKDEPEKEVVKKSTLNPNAKEFNPNAKPFVPAAAAAAAQPQPVFQPQGQHRQQQIPTPPRQTQQSPVSQYPPQFNHPHQQAIYSQVPFQQFPNMGGPIPQPNFQATLQQQPQRKKVAVVSVETANHASMVAGSPLIHSQPYQQQAVYHVMGQQHQQNAAINYQQHQQAAAAHFMNQPRMVNPQQVAAMSLPQPVPASPGQVSNIFVQGPGPMQPGHIQAPQGQHQQIHPGFPHLQSRATPPQSQATSHPAPSPAAPNQNHPPSSATPTQIVYHPNPQIPQQPHPPLQPSPHTPTSPQNMQPVSVAYATYPQHQFQNPAGAPQVSMASGHPVTASMVYGGPQPHPGQPMMFMQAPQPQHNMQPGHPQHVPHGPPQVQHMGHSIPQQGHHMGQQAMAQVQYAPAVHPPAHHQQMPTFQQISQ